MKRKIKGWVGYCDGRLVKVTESSPFHGGVRRADFLFNERDARRCYVGVRRATLIIEEPRKKAPHA